MPLYEYHCEGGHRFERIVPLARFDDPQACECGDPAKRLVCAPMVISDDITPVRGADGRIHESRQSLASANRGKFEPLEYGEGLASGTVVESTEEDRVNDIKAAIADIDAGRPPQFT